MRTLRDGVNGMDGEDKCLAALLSVLLFVVINWFPSF